jgi:hypothetical protein
MEHEGVERSVDMVGQRLAWCFALALLGCAWWAEPAGAATAREIDVSADVALEAFQKEVAGAKEFLESSKGVLVLPKVLKAGVGFGGEYGEGALRIASKTVDYYNIASASFGFQFGGQMKTVILLFMQEEALKQFWASEGWKAGAEGSKFTRLRREPRSSSHRRMRGGCPPKPWRRRAASAGSAEVSIGATAVKPWGSTRLNK